MSTFSINKIIHRFVFATMVKGTRAPKRPNVALAASAAMRPPEVMAKGKGATKQQKLALATTVISAPPSLSDSKEPCVTDSVIDSHSLVKFVSLMNFSKWFSPMPRKLVIVVDVLNFLHGGFGDRIYADIITSTDYYITSKLAKVRESVLAFATLIYSIISQGAELELSFVAQQITIPHGTSSKMVDRYHINNCNLIRTIFNYDGNGVPMGLLTNANFYFAVLNGRKDVDDVLFSAFVLSSVIAGCSVLAITDDKSMTGSSMSEMKDIVFKRCTFADTAIVDPDVPSRHIRTTVGSSVTLKIGSLVPKTDCSDKIVVLTPRTFKSTFEGSILAYIGMLVANQNKMRMRAERLAEDLAQFSA